MKSTSVLRAHLTRLSAVKNVGLLTAAGVLAVMVVSSLAYVSQRSLEDDLTTSSAIHDVLHAQGEADGANHAIQFDAITIVTTENAEDRDAADADLQERVTTLQEGYDTDEAILTQLHAPTSTMNALQALKEPLASYKAAAEHMLATDLTPEQVAEASDTLNDAQGTYDAQFDEVTEQVTTFVENDHKQADDQAARYRMMILSVAGLALVVLPAAGLAVRRSLRSTTAQVTSAAEDVASSATGVSSELQRSAQSTVREATEAATTAGVVSESISMLADSVEQLRTSVGEIARSAGAAAGVASEAMTEVHTTTGMVSKLGESSDKIGTVIDVITSIAEQTNLLALNATIEAARAGEAGKGFAVVANEVKELAKQTAAATQEISSLIIAIRDDAGEVASAISGMATVMAQINDSQATIASAVEEQTAVTTEISQSIGGAAMGANDIARRVQTVLDAANQTSDAARSVGSWPARMFDIAGRLSSAMGVRSRAKAQATTPASVRQPQPRRSLTDAPAPTDIVDSSKATYVQR